MLRAYIIVDTIVCTKNIAVYQFDSISKNYFLQKAIFFFLQEP